RQRLVDHRLEYDARLLLDVLEHLSQLLFGADQREYVLDRPRVLVLRRHRAPGGEQCLAGGVGDQMEGEEALSFVHLFTGFSGSLWAPVDKVGRFRPTLPGDCIRWPDVHNSPLSEDRFARWEDSGDKVGPLRPTQISHRSGSSQVAAKPRRIQIIPRVVL